MSEKVIIDGVNEAKMNEIEKMFENAGIDRQYWCVMKDIYCPIEDVGKFNPKCAKTKVTFDCEVRSPIAQYPEFTAEKQLELIKFLFNHNVYYDVDEKGNYWFHITDDCYTYYYNKFEIALANIINEMWQDLTEEEKSEIKRILK